MGNNAASSTTLGFLGKVARILALGVFWEYYVIHYGQILCRSKCTMFYGNNLRDYKEHILGQYKYLLYLWLRLGRFFVGEPTTRM